jgi:hypothetical protein
MARGGIERKHCNRLDTTKPTVTEDRNGSVRGLSSSGGRHSLRDTKGVREATESTGRSFVIGDVKGSLDDGPRTAGSSP